MATIEHSIALSDGATAPLQRMARALEVTTERFEAATAAANRIDTAVSSTTVQKVNQIGQKADYAAQSFDTAAGSANQFDNAVSGAAAQKMTSVGAAAYSTVPAFGAASVAAETTAGSVGAIGAAATTARAGVVALGATMTAVFGSIMAIIGAIIAALRAILGSVRLSDEFSQTTARLNLMNDGLQTTAQLQAMIFASAQRSRSEYQATADFVAKIGMMAGKIFTSNTELIGVAETINKIFKISGTSAQEQASATLQLSQALASGVLRGEELNAVFEAAPMMIQKIADYLNVDIGQIRAMAEEGQLSAAIVKNAMIAAADGVNQTYATIPKTWGDIWTDFKNVALAGLQPLFQTISALANNQGVQTFFNILASGVALAGMGVAGLINGFIWFGNVVGSVGAYAGSWLSALQPIFEWLAAFAMSFFIVYAAGWVTAQIPLLAHIAALKVKAGWDAILIAYTWAQSAATVALNTQLLLSYTRLGLVAGATALWALVTKGMTAAMRMLNLTLFMNPIGIVIGLVFLIIAAFGAWAIHTRGLRNSIASAFSSIAEITGSVINFMIRRVNDLVGILNGAAGLINSVFGTNIATVGLIAEVDSKGWGKSAGDFIKNFDTGKLGSMLGLPEMPDVGGSMPPIATDIAAAGKDTAGNTKGIKEAMEITDEDIKYMRDIAEQEVINRYTTAEVKIELKQDNTINNPDDFDGMVRYMEESLFEAMVSGAEKVHP